VQLQDYITQIRVLCHDLAGNDWTNGELTNITNAARTRTALDLHCVRMFDGGPSGFAGANPNLFNVVTGQEIYPINGGIPGCTITNGGSYSVPPTVTFNVPTNGIQAKGTAVLGTPLPAPVVQIIMTNWGTGYVGAPGDTVGFSTGSATAVPNTFVNVIDFLSLSFMWPGQTNRTTMRWLPFTTYQAWCRMYQGYIGSPTAWTTHDSSNELFIFPVPDQPYIMEFDWLTLPIPLVNLTDLETQINAPFNDCVQYYGAFLARTKLQDYDKADYYRKLYNTRTKEVNATRQDRRIPNIYRSSARRMMRW
jgi:hypothetical protein